MKDQLRKLLLDFSESISQWRLWLHLGWNDVATQYRRSFLGPMWITLSTGLFVFAFGLLGSQIMGFDVYEFIPYFATGFILFGWMSSLVTDACKAFEGSSAYLKHAAFPKMIVVFRVVVRNLVMFLHNFVIILVVLVWADLILVSAWLYWLIGICVFTLASVFVVAILGALAARFRDIAMMVTTLMQIMFFMTPVFWRSDQLTERAQWLVILNPFASFLEILRAPLLGSPPSLMAFQATLIMVFSLFVLFILVFAFARRRIVYWV